MRQPPRLKRLKSRLTTLLVLVLALTACGGGPVGADRAAERDGSKSTRDRPAEGHADRVEPLGGPAPTPRLPVEIDSADGRRVTVDSVARIVPLSGSLAEIVFSLGLVESVVARDITATFEQARDLPVVTHGHDVSAEGVLSLEPTVVLAETTTGPGEVVAQIREAGIPLVVVETAKKPADVGTRIDDVAEVLGVPAAGDRLRERSEQRIAAARKDVPDSGEKPRVAFLYLRGSASVYLLGGARSGAASLIEAAGGVDAGSASGLEKDFTPVTSEALAAAAPDVILVMTKGLESVGGVDGLLKIPGVAQTPAGMDRRIASVDDGLLLSYGPRTDQVLRSLIDQIHEGGQ